MSKAGRHVVRLLFALILFSVASAENFWEWSQGGGWLDLLLGIALLSFSLGALVSVAKLLIGLRRVELPE